MKMGPGIIIGVIIILIGLSILFKDFPFFRIVFGILLILWGVSVIVGGFNHRRHWWNKDPNNVIFGESNFKHDGNVKEYNVVFGKSNFDFRNIPIPEKGTSVSVHTVFGASEIWISKTMPVRITANSAFGEAKMPNGNSSAFGTINYTTESYKEDSVCLDLRIDVAFGSAIVREL
jgi:predicted membrane protein